MGLDCERLILEAQTASKTLLFNKKDNANGGKLPGEGRQVTASVAKRLRTAFLKLPFVEEDKSAW